MKKYIIAAIVFLSLGLAFPSCTNPDVSFTKNVSVTVSPYHVLADIVGHNYDDDGGKSMISGSRLSMFLYVFSSDGSLYTKYDASLENYNEDATFTVQGLDVEQTYTLLAVCYPHNSSTQDAFSMSNTTSLDNFTITQNGWYSYSCNSLLGLGSMMFSPQSSSSLNLSMKPASAMIVSLFLNIHYWDNANVDSYELFYVCNDLVNYSGNGTFSYSKQTSTSLGISEDISVEDFPDSYGIYTSRFDLPISNGKIKSSLASGTDVYSISEQSYSLIAGNTYETTFDCEELSVSFNSITQSKAINSPIDAIPMYSVDRMQQNFRGDCSVKVSDLLNLK